MSELGRVLAVSRGMQRVHLPRALADPLVAGYVLAVAAWCLGVATGLVAAPTDVRSWYVCRLPDPYQVVSYAAGQGFWFTPPIAFVLFPFTYLSWPVFAAGWTALQFAALGYLLRRWAFVGLLVPPIWWELMAGNVALFMAVAIVVGMRRAVAWTPVILLKLTPAVGMLWFAVRREWRFLGVALLATGLVGAVTFVISPDLWRDWWSVIVANASASGPGYFTIQVPLPIRLVAAAIVVAWGARSDRRWTVAAAAALGAPVLWFNALAVLAAVPRLVSPEFGAPRPFESLLDE